jgi:signal transduction histidine kinase/ActR/RegA family two-component response regulator
MSVPQAAPPDPLAASAPKVRRTVGLALAVPLAMIGLLAAAMLWQARALFRYNRAVVHTQDVIGETWRATNLLIDHETGMRAFLLARDPVFLEPYQAAAAQLTPALDRLARLVADNQEQAARVAALRSRYAGWYGRAQAAITSGVPDRAGVLAHLTAGKKDMDDMRGITQAILTEEGNLLAARQEQARRGTRRLIVLAAALSVGLAIVASLVLRRLIGRLEGAYAAAYQQQAESARRAEEANRLKDEFLATLSHELRTPLNAIVGWAHLLQAGTREPAVVDRAIEVIHRNALAQSQLIADLLDVSRIITGKLRLDVGAVDLAAVVESARETVAVAAEAKGIAVRTVVAAGAAAVSGDAARLQQVVWNLLSNAIKFTPAGGTIELRLERAASHVQIVVTDDGPGIPESVLPHVFERFRQADASASRAHGGLGLGLAIVRHLIELHGGTVSAANRADTRGAVFTVRLPLRAVATAPPARDAAARAAAATREAAVAAAPSLAGLRVLAVDDEEDARDLVREALTRCGAEVFVASSAAGGVEAVRQHGPHVIVADIGMPGEDGYAFMERVRGLPGDRGGATPALALTAFAGGTDRLKALQAGYQMHVAKPVDPTELAVMVASLAQPSPR